MNFSYGGWPVWEGNFELINSDPTNKRNTKTINGELQVLVPPNPKKIEEFYNPTKAVITTKQKRRFVVEVKPLNRQEMPKEFWEILKNPEDQENLNIFGLVLMENYGLCNIYVAGKYTSENLILVHLVKILNGKKMLESMGSINLEKTDKYNLSLKFSGILCLIQ